MCALRYDRVTCKGDHFSISCIVHENMVEKKPSYFTSSGHGYNVYSTVATIIIMQSIWPIFGGVYQGPLPMVYTIYSW